MTKECNNICVGGTFSPFHIGHYDLLTEAFKRGEHIWIGITTNEMAQKDRERKIEDILTRANNVSRIASHLSKRHGGNPYITQIDTPHGRALKESMDGIVVSEETETVAIEINEMREKEGIAPLKIFTVQVILDERRRKISSTNIAKGEVNVFGFKCL